MTDGVEVGSADKLAGYGNSDRDPARIASIDAGKLRSCFARVEQVEQFIPSAKRSTLQTLPVQALLQPRSLSKERENQRDAATSCNRGSNWEAEFMFGIQTRAD